MSTRFKESSLGQLPDLMASLGMVQHIALGELLSLDRVNPCFLDLRK